MKLKITLTAILSVIIFNLIPMTVHAETDEQENNEPIAYQYYFNYTTVQPGGYAMYVFEENTYTSSQRLGFIINGKYTVYNSVGIETEVDRIFLVYHSELDDSNLGINNEYSNVKKSANGTVVGEYSNKGTVYAAPYPYVNAQNIGSRGTGYFDLKTNIPIFRNFEDLEHYFLTGDTSAAVNVSSFNGDVYDETMPGVTGLSVKGLTEKECHQQYESCLGCIHLTWGTPDGYKYSDTYTIKFLLKYNYTTYHSTKRYYGSTMIDLSEIDDFPVYIHDFGVDLCAYDLLKKLDLPVRNEFDYVTSFDIQEVQKVYMRSSRRDAGRYLYGDWYVYDCKKKTLSWDSKYEHVGEGTIVSGDAIFDGEGNVIDQGTIKDTIPAPEEEENNGFLFGIDFTNVGGVISNFYSILQNLLAAIGSFPQLFASVFLFLPSEITSAFVLVFYMALIIGLIKIFK